jgi:uncharacterized repeat protein (TIGR02543 family)
MEPKKLLTTFALVAVVLIAGCKKDTFVDPVGVCPLVVSTDPANLATGVLLNKVITATFNENMNPATITGTSFTVEAVVKGEMLIAGAVTYTGMTASFTPASPLAGGTTYKGTIKASVKDLLGTSLQGDYTWTFSTGAVVVPTVILTDPLNLATGVALNKTVTADFSVAMNGTTLTATTFTLFNGATQVAGAVSYAGVQASFNPTVDLLPGILYTATITTGAMTPAGVPLAANKVWTFTTLSSIPTVILTDPLDLATGVAINKTVTADFSEAMNGTTLTATTFTLFNGLIPVTGVVSYAGVQASFNPDVDLLPGILYTATITTGAMTPGGVPLASNKVWTFTTLAATYTLNVTATNGSVVKNPDLANYNSGVTVDLTASGDPGYAFDSWSGDATGNTNPLTVTMDANKNITANFIVSPPLGPGAVNLGTAANFAAIGKAGISTTGVTLITGDIGVSPIDQTALTGFSQTMDVSNTFSTSVYVVGNIYASDYAVPTPAYLTTAVADMETAFTTANGLTTDVIVDLGAGDISGMTLAPGLYKYNTGLLITGAGVTLAGGPNDTWVFQISGDLTVMSGAIVTLSGGALAKNIFWVTATQAVLGTTVDFKGNILSQTLISLDNGASVLGRLLAQTGVTLIGSTVTKP